MAFAIGACKFRGWGVQMGLVAGGDLQNAGFDLDEALRVEPGPHGARDCHPSHQEGTDVGMAVFRPPGRDRGLSGHQPPARSNRKRLESADKISMLRPETASDTSKSDALWHLAPPRSPALISGRTALKVIASSIRKGNVLEQDGKLYVVLSAENIHPGKGTPVSQIEMRRISDGVKVSERYKTTDQVEKVTIEERNYTYLYEDPDGFHFMNPETFDQVQVPKDVVGTQAAYLQENMTVKLSMHDTNPVAIALPQRVTLEVVDTEPVTKGQTASSSYKPAVLSNGVRTGVPPHITVGTRIVVMTEDGSYCERAKD
jgi:elongation factor P